MEQVGEVPASIKKMLGISVSETKIIVDRIGFRKHLMKRKHDNMLKYLDKIQIFLQKPDYVGINPREKDISLEYVILTDDNVLIGMKLDYKNHYFYLATMHEISDLKLEQRKKTGRLKSLTSGNKHAKIRLRDQPRVERFLPHLYWATDIWYLR